MRAEVFLSVSVSVCMTLCTINQHKLGIQGQRLYNDKNKKYKVRTDVFLSMSVLCRSVPSTKTSLVFKDSDCLR